MTMTRAANEGNGLIFLGIPRERFYYPQFVDNRDRVLSSLNQAGRYCGLMQAEGHRLLDKYRCGEWLEPVVFGSIARETDKDGTGLASARSK